jgi:hypothetical protein
MKKKEKICHLSKKKRDMLDDLIEKGATDEMGLLDLIFIEEILNQNEREKTG